MDWSRGFWSSGRTGSSDLTSVLGSGPRPRSPEVGAATRTEPPAEVRPGQADSQSQGVGSSTPACATPEAAGPRSLSRRERGLRHDPPSGEGPREPGGDGRGEGGRRVGLGEEEQAELEPQVDGVTHALGRLLVHEGLVEQSREVPEAVASRSQKSPPRHSLPPRPGPSLPRPGLRPRLVQCGAVRMVGRA